MVVNEDEIQLIPMIGKDVNLFIEWLDKDYIYKRFCPDGEEERKAWMDEINNVNGKYNHFKHFIVNYNDKKIGFCLYMDCHFEQKYSQKVYGEIFDKNYAYEIGYCIGEEEYLNKGIGIIIVKKLEEKIIEIGGKELLADPDEINIASIKTLLKNGFIKIKDGDYRKKI
jgi:RimJ/RimL family protein N-acetyltransferase